MKLNRAKNFGNQFLDRYFDLPFCIHAIKMDNNGVKRIACLACKMAQKYASPIKADSSYARQMAVFITGHIASNLDSDSEKIQLFNTLIPEVSVWLDRVCGDIEESPDFESLGEMCDELKYL